MVGGYQVKRVYCAGNRLPEKSRSIATIPDFIYSQLTGKLVIDITTAQILGMCDFANACWDERIVDWSGLPRATLPYNFN